MLHQRYNEVNSDIKLLIQQSNKTLSKVDSLRGKHAAASQEIPSVLPLVICFKSIRRTLERKSKSEQGNTSLFVDAFYVHEKKKEMSLKVDT